MEIPSSSASLATSSRDLSKMTNTKSIVTPANLHSEMAKKPAGAADHEGKSFRPARNTNPRLYIVEHKHMQDINHVEKRFRDEEGGVAIGPRNFFTMPAKCGNP